MPFNRQGGSAFAAGTLLSGPAPAALVTRLLWSASVVLLLATSHPGLAVGQEEDIGTAPSCSASQWTAIMATTPLGGGGGGVWDALLDLNTAEPASPGPGNGSPGQIDLIAVAIGVALRTQYATECETLDENMIAQVFGCPEADSGCNELIDAVGGLSHLPGSLRDCIGIELGEEAIGALANLAVTCRSGTRNLNGYDTPALSRRHVRSDEDGADGGDGGSDSAHGGSGGDSGSDESGDGDDDGGDESGDGDDDGGGSGDDRTQTLSPDVANDFVVTTTFPGNLSTTSPSDQRLIIVAVNTEMAVAFGTALANVDTVLRAGGRAERDAPLHHAPFIVATTRVTDATLAAAVGDIAQIAVPALGITGSVNAVVAAPSLSPAPTQAPVASNDAGASSDDDGFNLGRSALGLCIVGIGVVFVAGIVHHFYYAHHTSGSRDLRSPVSGGGGGGGVPGLATPVSWSRKDSDLDALRRPDARPQSAWDDIPEVDEATMSASGSNHAASPSNGTVLMTDHAPSAELDGNLKHKLKSGVISKYEARQIALVHNRALEMELDMADGDIGGAAAVASEGRNAHRIDGAATTSTPSGPTVRLSSPWPSPPGAMETGGCNDGLDEDPSAHRKMRLSMLRNKLVREEITQHEHDAMAAVIKREAELDD